MDWSFGRNELCNQSITWEARLPLWPTGELVLFKSGEPRIYLDFGQDLTEEMAHDLIPMREIKSTLGMTGEHIWYASGLAMRRYGEILEVYVYGNKFVGIVSVRAFALAVAMVWRQADKTTDI